MEANSLMHTSVAAAKAALECALKSDAVKAAHLALALLEQLQEVDGQASRRKLAAGMLRKAATALAA